MHACSAAAPFSSRMPAVPNTSSCLGLGCSSRTLFEAEAQHAVPCHVAFTHLSTYHSTPRPLPLRPAIPYIHRTALAPWPSPSGLFDNQPSSADAGEY